MQLVGAEIQYKLMTLCRIMYHIVRDSQDYFLGNVDKAGHPLSLATLCFWFFEQRQAYWYFDTADSPVNMFYNIYEAKVAQMYRDT